MSIFKKINEVRRSVEYVKKDSTVQGYKAVSHDMVTAMVRDHLVEQGIVIVPSLSESVVSNTGTTTSNGTPIIRYEAKYNVTFYDEDSDSQVSMVVESHANDQGDKAPGKALSYAVKYAMLKMFNIETGEDDESRVEVQPKPYTQEEKDEMMEYISGGDGFGLVAFMSSKTHEVQNGLNNSFDSKAKSSGKEQIRVLTKDGVEKWQSLVLDIQTMVEGEDGYGLLEATSELSSTEKRHLMRVVGDRTAQKIGALVKAAKDCA